MKIEDQAEFVRWWQETVRASETAGRHEVARADRGALPMSAAESSTGITHQQVSRWRHSIAHCDEYRERLLGAGFKAASLMEAEGTNVRGTPVIFAAVR